jgi:glycosyltransferase involved in cell wall biosynthesis
MKSNPLVSVVIPAYNSEKTLGKCLDSVLKQDYPEFEVVIVDNGSRDGTKGIVERYGDPRLRYVLEETRTRGAARDTGVAAAKGRIILMTDSDCILPPDLISAMAAPIASGEYDAVQGSEDAVEAGFWSDQILRRSKMARDGRDGVLGSIDTKNFAIGKEHLKAVGGINRRYVTLEDTDLSVKLSRNRSRVKFLDDYRVRHHNPRNVSVIVRRYFESGYWSVRVSQDNRDILKGTDFNERANQTLWAWLRIFPGLIMTALFSGFGAAYFDLVTGMSWRAGVLWAMVHHG